MSVIERKTRKGRAPMSIHDGHRRRFKEEFLARPDTFPDHKLLELLLFYANPRGDTNPLAHTLVDRFVSLAGVLDASPEELREVPGVGDHTITLLKTVKELSGRYLAARTCPEGIVGSVAEAGEMLRPYFFGAQREKVYLLCMDGKGKNLGIRLVGEGSVNAAEVTSRSVAEAALSRNASRVILAHNHVSGIALPSPEDRATTERLKEVLWSVGVKLEDHLIFADDDMVSLRNSGFPF